MKNTWIKGFLAVIILLTTWSGATGSARAAASTASIMRDNLSKYGLVKDVELPVTITAGGLSYTLEKIMIYDAKSKDAQALIKKYGYKGTASAKYFIWTKITVENKSGNVVQWNYKDLKYKWRLSFGEETFAAMPAKTADFDNNKDALWTWSLTPGKKITSYQAYFYDANLKYFVVWLDNKSASAEKYIVSPPVE